MASLTHSNLRRDGLLALLSLLLLHVATCQAQSSSSISVAVPVSVIIVSFMCACFCVCFYVQRAKQRQYDGAPANIQYVPYVYNRGSGDAQPGPYPVQGCVVPSTTPAGVNPPQTQQAYPGQGYVPPSTAAVPDTSPLAPPGATQSPVQATSEPVSLPEATLHQGDAPPAYDEAIGMKTVDIADQDEQQA
jgi:hypothetical protein